MNHGTSDTCAIVAVLTVSDTRSIEDDRSGAIATEELIAAGHTIAERAIVRDVKSDIASAVLRWAEDESVHAIVVTGGTGPSRRDVTPEAVAPLMSAKLSGFGELFRQLSYEQIGAAAIAAMAEKEELFGKGLILTVIPETIVIFGLVVAILIIGLAG